MSTIYSFKDTDVLSSALAEYVSTISTAAIQKNGSFKVAISGGSLPKLLAKELIPLSTIDYSKWEIFFADERAVELDKEDSNFHLAQTEFFSKISIPKENIHIINTALLDNLSALADDYEQQLVKVFAAKDSVRTPVFDLLLLGAGPDGHTCSLFPSHKLLREEDAWVGWIDDSPKPPPRRITLTLPVVLHAHNIAFVTTGDGKAEILSKIFSGEHDDELPSAIVNSRGAEKVSWFLDEIATPSNAQTKAWVSSSI